MGLLGGPKVQIMWKTSLLILAVALLRSPINSSYLYPTLITHIGHGLWRTVRPSSLRPFIWHIKLIWGSKTKQNMAIDLVLLLACKTGLLTVSLFWACYMLKHHYPKLVFVWHEQLGQPQWDILFDILNLCGTQKLNEYGNWPSPSINMQDGTAKISFLGLIYSCIINQSLLDMNSGVRLIKSFDLICQTHVGLKNWTKYGYWPSSPINVKTGPRK